ncbi:hypothetical protein [Thalassobius vesicularis]|uniref:hypothetical protein n=1 Tax=Thalassobius vesicularis TaxID=1294297 RepID=UPI001FECB674|nr:hypothetical protein [Thalassobius vesicularis]
MTPLVTVSTVGFSAAWTAMESAITIESSITMPNAESAQLATEAANTTRILELERERLALAETDLERIRTLTAQGTVPQSRGDEAERATLLARRTVTELENSLALIPPREARIAAQIARSEAAIRAGRNRRHRRHRSCYSRHGADADRGPAMIRWFTGHPTAGNLLILLFLAAGVFAAPGLLRETFPDFRAVEAEIVVPYRGAAAEDVETAICAPRATSVVLNRSGPISSANRNTAATICVFRSSALCRPDICHLLLVITH